MRSLIFFLGLVLCSIRVYGQAVVLYEQPDFGGNSKELGVGEHLLTDFNDRVSSIKVPAGLVALIYEHATGGNNHGRSIDFLEDASDLTVYEMENKASSVVVFPSQRDNLVWVRNAMNNGQFIPGHWERKRARPLPANTTAVVSPPIPGPVPKDPSVLEVSGANTTIVQLGVQSPEGAGLWERAMQDQMGVIGNDYRGIEEIGSAAFQRESNNPAIPDFFNFWYPQKQQRDHRDVVYFKRTLAGKVKESRQVKIDGTFEDYDVCVDIIPNPKYMYLITDAHPREYTNIMKTQWELSGAAPLIEQSGLPNCDAPETIEEFSRVEAEIAEDDWPQGRHLFGRARLADLALIRTGNDMCVYGTWIYDRGHCCHPEIHPAEQLWWSEAQEGGKQYNLNVLCDASGRFWWRSQMDDGTKLKPWGAPPTKGIFAIAFEYELPRAEVAIGYTTRQFEVFDIKDHNVIRYPGADQTYKLLYQGRELVSFIPHNKAFKVSFEHVGIVPGEPNKIRGFLVIETSVGKAKQIATAIKQRVNGNSITIRLPENSQPEQAPEQYEKRFFKKEAGHYLFTVIESSVDNSSFVLDGRR